MFRHVHRQERRDKKEALGILFRDDLARARAAARVAMSKRVEAARALDDQTWIERINNA